MITAEKILKAEDTPDIEKVSTPEWGEDVYVRVMSGLERDRWELAVGKALDTPGKANVRAALCAMTICDETGKRIFTDNQAANLGIKSAIVLDRVFAVAKKLNQLNDEDVEELEKNSLAVVPAASGSS